MSIAGSCYYTACRNRVGHSILHSGVRLLRRIGAMRKPRMLLDALELDHGSVAGLARLWSRIHWSSGDGMMPPDQLLAVYRLAATWPVRGDIVELGSWIGLTTSYLATACRVRGEGKVHAVDTFRGTKEGGSRYASVERLGGSTLETFRDRIRRAGVDDIVEVLVGLTSDMVHRYQGQPIRMLLIDADHSYEGTRSDFELWSPLVAGGGLIVFHDLLMPDVARFVNDGVRSDPDIEMVPGEVVPNVMAVTKRSGRSLNLRGETSNSHPDMERARVMAVR